MSEQTISCPGEKKPPEIEGGVLHVHNFDSSRITVETSYSSDPLEKA